MTFSSENRYLDCIVIAKSFIDLVEGIMANATPFEMIRQDNISHRTNISEDTAAGLPESSTVVAET